MMYGSHIRDLIQFNLKLFLFTVYFFYIISVHFQGMPLGTRPLISFLGAVLFFFQALNLKHFYVARPLHAILIVGSFVGILICSALTVFVNCVFDAFLYKDQFLDLLCLPGFLLLAGFTRFVYKKMSFEIISKYIVGVVLLQNVISLIMFIYPDFSQIISNILVYSVATASAITRVEGGRLVGFGVTFFAAGIINSYALIIISGTVLRYKLSLTDLMFFVSSYVFIFLIGMMMSRTTLIGFILSFGLFILELRRLAGFKIFMKCFLAMVCILVLTAFILGNLSSADSNKYVGILSFGFELFLNYKATGELYTGSTNKMFRMYRFPNNIQTWLLGDGLMTNPVSFSYYKSTDIGFIRLIYYFGIFGLLAYSIQQGILLFIAHRINRHGALFFTLFLLYFLLSMKGLTSLTFLTIPFLFVDQRGYTAKTHDILREER